MDFLPTCREEMRAQNIDELDILLLTGDAYVDHPSYGVSLIGRLLQSRGYRVGIIAQMDWNDPESLKVMGRPRLGVGVTSGNMDSMVDLYTVGRRLRREDAYSENGVPGRRPPHALTVYAQLAKRAFPGIFVVLGGLEASLRRVAHYDYWQDKMRMSVLVDSKADILCYGMGEKPMPEIFRRLDRGESVRGIRGTAVLLGKKESESFVPGEDCVFLPSWEEMNSSRDALMAETKLVEREMNPFRGKRLLQKYNDRLLLIEPPPEPLNSQELDFVHTLPYMRLPHPKYKGRIPAFETIRDSVQSIRGCPGGCAFCGLVAHQGRQVMSRSENSILGEIKTISELPGFHGTISDIGGAAGNLFGSVQKREFCEKCRRSSCLFPQICPHYSCDGKRMAALLRKARTMPKVKHVHINSGVRLDLALRQEELLGEIIAHHVSGHLKVAPEHLSDKVLKLMRKNPAADFFRFKEVFEKESRKLGKEQYIIPLFISNFPGCTEGDMRLLNDFLDREHWSLQQVQDYIPLPMTMGAAMYYSGKTPEGEVIPVNRGLAERRPQISALKRDRSRRGTRPAGDRSGKFFRNDGKKRRAPHDGR